MSQSSKHIALWLVLALVFLVIFSVFSKQHSREPEIVFSEFMGSVDRGDVQEVVIQGHNIQGKYKNGERFRTFAPNDPELVKSLRDKKVKIAAKPEEDSPWYMVLLLNWFPMLLLIGVWIFFMRQMQVGGGKAMSFGKSRAKLLTENQHRIYFSDVAGVEEAKDVAGGCRHAEVAGGGQAEPLIGLAEEPDRVRYGRRLCSSPPGRMPTVPGRCWSSPSS